MSSTEMNKKMTGRKLIRLSQLKEKMASEKLEDIDWVTFAVIVKKITPQSCNSVSHYIDLVASSQIDENACSLFFNPKPASI